MEKQKTSLTRLYRKSKNDTRTSQLLYLSDITGVADDATTNKLLGDSNFYYTLIYSSSLVEHQLVKVNVSDLSGEVLVSSKDALFNGSSQLSHLTFNTDKTALYFTQDKNFFRYQLSNASLTLVSAFTYPVTGSFSPNHFIIDENKNRVILEADWSINDPYQNGTGFYVADLSGAETGVFSDYTASNQAGCVALPSGQALNQIEYSNSVYNDKIYITYDGARQTLATFDLTTDCLVNIADLKDFSPDLTDDSLQGIDFDPITRTIYLGHYTTTSAYNIDDNTLSIIEPQGFIKGANPVSEASFVIYDNVRDALYFSSSEKLIQWDLEESQQTILFSASDDITGITQSADGKTLYFSNDNNEIGSWNLDTSAYQLVVTDAPYDTEYVTAIDQNTLAFFDSDKIYTYDLTAKTFNLLSDEKNNAIRIWREDGMVHDKANQRLIIDNESNSKSRFVAINILDGSRTYLNDLNPIEGRVGLFDLSADGQSIIYEHNEALYSLNLSDDSTTLVNERYINGFSMAVRTAHSIFVADATVNGFWLINTLTGERTLVH